MVVLQNMKSLSHFLFHRKYINFIILIFILFTNWNDLYTSFFGYFNNFNDSANVLSKIYQASLLTKVVFLYFWRIRVALDTCYVGINFPPKTLTELHYKADSHPNSYTLVHTVLYFFQINDIWPQCELNIVVHLLS